jgi:heme-degrading monooxygenase HmoA
LSAIKVKDFAAWKPLYDGHESTRKVSGSKGARVFWNADDPREILILFLWNDLPDARKFASSEDLKQRMQQAGVIDKPEISFFEESCRSPA